MNTYTRRKGKNELHGTIVWYGVFEELKRGVEIFGNGRRKSSSRFLELLTRWIVNPSRAKFPFFLSFPFLFFFSFFLSSKKIINRNMVYVYIYIERERGAMD